MGILTILGSAFMGSALLLTGYVSAPAAYHPSEERGGGEARGGKQREERASLGVPLYLTVLLASAMFHFPVADLEGRTNVVAT